MKKVIALLAVCGFAFALVACGKKAETTASEVDSVAVTPTEVVAVDSAAAVDTTAVDTAAVAH